MQSEMAAFIDAGACPLSHLSISIIIDFGSLVITHPPPFHPHAYLQPFHMTLHRGLDIWCALG